jgi:hypothetical protein
MKPLVKGLLAGCVVLIVIAGIAVIAAVRWVRANKDGLRAQADAVRAEGRESGRSVDAPACVARAMERYRGDTSLIGEARARIWLTGCLESSRPDAAFCTQVPRDSEILRTVTWRLNECSRLGFEGDKGCTRVLQEVQRACEARRAP